MTYCGDFLVTYVAMSHRVIFNVETYKMLRLHQETIMIDVTNVIAYILEPL